MEVTWTVSETGQKAGRPVGHGRGRYRVLALWEEALCRQERAGQEMPTSEDQSHRFSQARAAEVEGKPGPGSRQDSDYWQYMSGMARLSGFVCRGRGPILGTWALGPESSCPTPGTSLQAWALKGISGVTPLPSSPQPSLSCRFSPLLHQAFQLPPAPAHPWRPPVAVRRRASSLSTGFSQDLPEKDMQDKWTRDGTESRQHREKGSVQPLSHPHHGS